MKEVELLKLNVLNKNKRIYTKESFKEIPEKVFLYGDSEGNLDFQNIIGEIIDIKIKENSLIGELKTFKSFTLNEEEICYYFVIRSFGEGEIEDDKVINYVMKGCNLVDKEEDAFNEI